MNAGRRGNSSANRHVRPRAGFPVVAIVRVSQGRPALSWSGQPDKCGWNPFAARLNYAGAPERNLDLCRGQAATGVRACEGGELFEGPGRRVHAEFLE